jgi:hypothetical protein
MIQAVEKSMGSLLTLKTSTMSVEGQRKIQTTLDECQGMMTDLTGRYVKSLLYMLVVLVM